MFVILDELGRRIKSLSDLDDRSGKLTSFEGKQSERFRVKGWRSQNGHVEATAVRCTDWSETDWSHSMLLKELEWADMQRAKKTAEALAAEAEEKAQKNRLRACKRAEKRVRRLCKAAGMDTLLTLTYRVCVTDLDRAKRDLKEFNRRMCRLVPDFQFVACFERQKRGAWHMHLATVRVPESLAAKNGVMVKSFNVIRAVWRSVTKEAEGNIDVVRRKRNSRRSAAAIAKYIAKYIAKDFEGGDKWVNRYAVYGVDVVEPSEVDGYVGSLHDAVETVFAMAAGPDRIAYFTLGRWRDVVCLGAEPPG